jgi:hypothetical protein
MEIHESTKINQEVFKNIKITSQESVIIKTLEKFYEDKFNIDLFIPIVNSDPKMSIRLIDHFVTKYSKIHKINYKLKENDVEQVFNVYTSYKQQLKGFQKRHFDPFSRGDRIPYFIADSCVITTIGQLNFFKWFISKRVYNYIRDNQEQIDNDMNKKPKCYKKKEKYKKTKLSQPSYVAPISTTCSNYRPINNNLLTFTKNEKIVVSFSFN